MIAGIGLLPGICVRLFIGTTLSTMTQESMSFSNLINGENAPYIIALIVAGVILAIVGITYMTRLTKRYLKQLELQIKEEE